MLWPETLPHPTPTQMEQLEAYTALLLKWNTTHNLIGRSTTPDALARHIWDSAQIVPHLPTAMETEELDSPRHVLDVGTGAGLPGMVLAILCPHLHFTLCERIAKKASFLKIVKQNIGLSNIAICADDCATLPEKSFDIVTARAVAALSDLLPLTQPLLAPKGYWLLLKGQAYLTEIEAYPPAKNMTISADKSITDALGVVLTIRPDAQS
ncbi:MAG: 16S rRNA (guanine(527)-N(7))-methyltransferase RsmG [Alphaproteobacteria bacterium CG_4_10_14_0_8_um_filter_53_9]|nr:MAG: 16S rRNA (guanine(527)-N(7))-methyltransferase RsmG [Alphaproteobacteria bacterium CG_4_10_14_0_8_um_filter_53_9]